METRSGPAKGARPYVSVAFVNRNDGYGGDLETRIAKFIEYYSFFARKWPGLFEFVICDWNPPPDRPKLPDAFQWGELGNVVHVEVPPAVHESVAGARGRKMLDYWGRNVAIRRGSGEFVLVLNQDIFVGEGILEQIAERKLSARHFYRADRHDFDFTPCRHVRAREFEAVAAANVFQVHRRHNSGDQPISLRVGAADALAAGSKPEPGDTVDAVNCIIDCTSAKSVRRSDMLKLWKWRLLRWRRQELQDWHEDFTNEKYHRRFFLHTNASGDFVLARRKAFDDIHGMLQSTEIYMHTDSYAMVQLFAAGYRQAIFAGPHRVYHADHDRSARAGFRESMTWTEHEVMLSDIARRKRTFKLNGPDWGLRDAELPTLRQSSY